jgi:hypothetical protein
VGEKEEEEVGYGQFLGWRIPGWFLIAGARSGDPRQKAKGVLRKRKSQVLGTALPQTALDNAVTTEVALVAPASALGKQEGTPLGQRLADEVYSGRTEASRQRQARLDQGQGALQRLATQKIVKQPQQVCLETRYALHATQPTTGANRVTELAVFGSGTHESLCQMATKAATLGFCSLKGHIDYPLGSSVCGSRGRRQFWVGQTAGWRYDHLATGCRGATDDTGIVTGLLL